MQDIQSEKKSTFNVLNHINVNDFVEKKEGLTYLSWASAVEIVKTIFPNMSYEIERFDGKPYLFDEDLGYMVFTSVTINNETNTMWLPVMDSKNKAMKNVPYEYKTKSGVKTVNKASMFDINTAIMRCLTKNLAMFGLGLYINRGEDIPSEDRAEDLMNEMVAWNEYRNELTTLGCDFRNEEVNNFILKNANVTTQNIEEYHVFNIAELKRLNEVYRQMIKSKKKQKKENVKNED